MRDRDFEARALRFERDWLRRGRAEILDHLPGPGSPDRRRVLVELVCLDLEFRWRGHADPARLEAYLARFPELGPLDRLPVELIGEEYRARRRWGDRPSHAGFLARFRDRRELIREELGRVDAELARESGPAPPDVPRAAPPPGPGGDAPDVPLLTDRDFRLKRMIGQGRMGKVYEADRRGPGGAVAVKFLRRTLLGHPRAVRRFLGEAETVARLDHPNIVGTHGLGRTAGGSYFLVLELVRGPSLAEVVARGAVGVGQAVRWAMEACEALDYAHGRGVVHCDLKPANLLLDEGGHVRVADFGLARSLAGCAPWSAEVEGTAAFMAPEQASRCWGPIGRRTDVYGLGAVLFALLTGRPPFAGRRLPEVLARVVAATPAPSPLGPRPGLPGPLVDVCRKCLAKPPEGRFATAAEVRGALAGVPLDPPGEGPIMIGHRSDPPPALPADNPGPTRPEDPR